MRDEAVEFMHDEHEAEMIQGKLATDHVDDDDAPKDEVREERSDAEDLPMEEEEEKAAG